MGQGEVLRFMGAIGAIRYLFMYFKTFYVFLKFLTTAIRKFNMYKGIYKISQPEILKDDLE